MKSSHACLLALALAIAAPLCSAADYVQAPGSSLTFAGSYQGETFVGRFPAFTTRMTFDPANLPAARLDVGIALTSATTGIGDYDGELRGADFFDSARFARARYTASRFRSLGDGRYVADGSLSLRGVSRPVALEFSWTPGPRPLLVGKATVPRLAFGVGGGDWADTALLPDAIAVATRVVLQPAK
ncbi:YceI family protein [soil metagenome]